MWWKRKPEDFKAEIDAHLQLEADELRAEGLTSIEAQAAARRALGNRTSAEERFYESGGWMLGQHLVRDLRFAARVLTKDAKFSVLAVLGLALGIGVSTAIFALVGTLLNIGIETVRNPATYVGLERRALDRAFSFAEYRYFQDHAVSIEETSAESAPYHFVLGAISPGADSEDVIARFESGSFLTVRRLPPALGRIFSVEEEQAGSSPVAILSYRFWQQRFSGDSGIIGKTIVLNAHSVTIVGVANSQFREGEASALVLPLSAQPVLLDRGDWLHDSEPAWLTVTARIRPGVTLPRAQAEADVLGKAFALSTPALSPTPNSATARKMDGGVLLSAGGVKPQRWLDGAQISFAINAGVTMILLIACSNLASLLLARATVRRREIGVRLSLGASRSRLICQLLTESLLLALAGGALGMAFSYWLAKWLFVSLNQGPAIELRLDYRVLLYGLILTVLTGLSFGIGPALAATKTNLARALHSDGLSGTPRSPSQKIWSPRNLLVVLPLAASLMLLIGAAVMVRTVKLGQLTGLAFDTSRMIGMSFRLKQQGYDEARTVQFQENLRERLSATPGVTSVAMATALPLSPITNSMSAYCRPQIEGSAGSFTICNVVSTAFFETLGVPPVRGRAFSTSDRQGSTPVVMVNQALARRYWPNQEPIGKHIGADGGGTSFEVVGVASDFSATTNELFLIPTVYVPSGQGNLWLTSPQSGVSNSARFSSPRFQIDQMQFLIRTSGDPVTMKTYLRQAVRASDPSLWVKIQTIEESLEPFTGPSRTVMFVLSALGALVLVMASAGIYALLAFAVSQRTREIGIRMALGAHESQILSLVMQRTLILIAWGIALGFAGAVALNRILASVVHDTKGLHIFTCISVTVMLGAVSLLASYLPARKALRVDPVQALRCD